MDKKSARTKNNQTKNANVERRAYAFPIREVQHALVVRNTDTENE